MSARRGLAAALATLIAAVIPTFRAPASCHRRGARAGAVITYADAQTLMAQS